MACTLPDRILPAARPSAPSGARNFLRDVVALLSFWAARSAQRRDLSDLDDRLLADIGITPEAARRECAKPFWRPLDLPLP